MYVCEFGQLEVLNILDGVTVCSYSKWDPVRFSEQWPEFVEMDRVLS